MFSITRSPSVVIAVFLAAVLGAVTPYRPGEIPHQIKLAQEGPESQFLAENEVAMSKMMTNMSIEPTGDIDRDFVDMMAPHHQGAVDMAMSELKYGHNEQLRRLAQEIIVTQQQEIAVMRHAISEKEPAAQ